MELSSLVLDLAGVFLAGVLVGYVIRALVSARRRARARRCQRRNDFNNHLSEDTLRDFPLAQPLRLQKHPIELQRGAQNVAVSPMRPI